MASLVWLNSACSCSPADSLHSHVSACSQQALCYYVKNTDEQLGNVKDIHQSDSHCQWFDKSLLTFWNCYLIFEMAAVSCGTSHASAVSTPLWWIFKNVLQKASHLCRITCERNESAWEWRIALLTQGHFTQITVTVSYMQNEHNE